MDLSVIIVVVVVTALAFDFTNGFHDTADAMATSIATGALRPRTAVLIAGALNLVGAFLSVEVARTISSGLVDETRITPVVVFAGLVGAIVWNLLTWLLGLPSSSSHALFGGLIGATWVATGAEEFAAVVGKVLLPALLSPLVVGVITLTLISAGALPPDAGPPFWVILSAGLAIALGTYLGGWRIIQTLGKRVSEIQTPQGFAAETTSAAVILTSSHLGFALSTTQVATGSVFGAGAGRRLASVQWGVAGQMAPAWLLTLPAAAVVGAVAAAVAGTLGTVVVAVVGAAVPAGIYAASRRRPVTADNVNDVPDRRPATAAA